MNEKEYLDYIEEWKKQNKDLIESEKCRKVFLECLPRGGVSLRKEAINWSKTINSQIYFIYKHIKGFIIILDYDKQSCKLKIKYNEDIMDILNSSFAKCSLANILKLRTPDFKINIGTILQDTKRNILITGTSYKEDKNGRNRKWYKYKCNNCGWKEGWTEESSLLKGTGCSCCANHTAVLGINTIWDTDKWMIPYVGEECAKTHVHCCSDKIYATCPNCKTVKTKLISISKIYNRKTVSCICNDNVSYSEKLMFNVLEQLELKFQTQLSKTNFKWCDKYRYDFYFELNSKQYIIETHGKQHYEEGFQRIKNSTRYIKTVQEVQQNDRFKKELALQNGIKEENYIVIDCRKSELEFIKQNIFNSRLSELFNLNKINWLKAEEFALSNLVKKACNLWESGIYSTSKIGKIMNLSNVTVLKYLKNGSLLNWCNYTVEIAKQEPNKQAIKSTKKQVYCLENSTVYSGVYECSKKLKEDLSLTISGSSISQNCRNESKQAKGLHFKYISDLTPKEYVEYNIENKLQKLELYK